ncbi:UNVERIFIED_CONTAM: zinc finger protein 26 [Trichonephila clavipes]
MTLELRLIFLPKGCLLKDGLGRKMNQDFFFLFKVFSSHVVCLNSKTSTISPNGFVFRGEDDKRYQTDEWISTNVISSLPGNISHLQDCFSFTLREPNSVNFKMFPTPPRTCSDCGKTFTRQSSLVDHMKIHAGVKPFKCIYCEKAFCKKYNLRVHELTHKKIKHL